MWPIDLTALRARIRAANAARDRARIAIAHSRERVARTAERAQRLGRGAATGEAEQATAPEGRSRPT